MDPHTSQTHDTSATARRTSPDFGGPTSRDEPTAAAQLILFPPLRTVLRSRPRSAAPAQIDPECDAPDPSLIHNLGADRCAALGVLPWRRSAGHIIVLTADPDTPARFGNQIRSALGPVRFAQCDRAKLVRVLTDVSGADLVRAAEHCVPADESCRGDTMRGLRRGLVLLVGLSVLATLLWPGGVLTALLGLSVIAMVGNTVPKAAALWCAATEQVSEPPAAAPEPLQLPVISILVPLFHEADIASHLLARLAQLDYPQDRLDLCLILEEEDWMTRATLATTRLPPSAQVITVPKGTLQTKPRAMNFAMNFARGSIVGIYDAEDAPAPDQLRKVVQRFAERGPDVACLQGRLDFYNTGTNWMARCFTLEYAGWFRMILPALQRLRLPIPLGGTTLFLRREALDAVSGWDAHNVTEDADLGVRLARHGFRTELIETTTREEANASPWPWVRQRSRWLKGYAMTYAVHMSRPVQLWRDLGGWGFLGVQCVFLGSLLQLAFAPLLWTFWLVPFGVPHPALTFVPTTLHLPLFALFILSGLISTAVLWVAAARSGRPMLGLWAPTLMLYFPLATIAVYKALWEVMHRPFYWDKTRHGAFGGSTPEVANRPSPPLPHPV